MIRFPKTDTTLLTAIMLVLGLSVTIAQWDQNLFGTRFAIEDGPVEYATALFLILSGGVLLQSKSQLISAHRMGRAFTTLYATVFFLAAAEEISWGQRIFGWGTGDFFAANNFQDETNLHNLVVGDVHLATTVFGTLLSLVILLYLVGLPLLTPRLTWLAGLMKKIALPIPGKRHALIAVVATLVIGAIDAPRKWEVYELVFALLTVSIFLNPSNRLYRKQNRPARITMGWWYDPA
ncbi:hypothetical protein NBRC116601_27130 [Cognatishimia sp. WU-CL00825]|uniref:hypothetical protein n=1 Tax=Cognatishimia sp. WU-CL00825 TaxID=3127658 RepID=UPI00310C15F3